MTYLSGSEDGCRSDLLRFDVSISVKFLFSSDWASCCSSSCVSSVGLFTVAFASTLFKMLFVLTDGVFGVFFTGMVFICLDVFGVFGIFDVFGGFGVFGVFGVIVFPIFVGCLVSFAKRSDALCTFVSVARYLGRTLHYTVLHSSHHAHRVLYQRRRGQDTANPIL